MSTTVAEKLCSCGRALNGSNRCTNPDCPKAAESATRGAVRSTRKATAGASARTNQPRAFRRSGGVD